MAGNRPMRPARPRQMNGGNTWGTCRTALGMIERQGHDPSSIQYRYVAALARQDRTKMQQLLSFTATVSEPDR